jgi:two-component system, cell cycle response regulator DivK
MLDPSPPHVRSLAHLREAAVLVVEDNLADFVLRACLLAYLGVTWCEWKTSGWQVGEIAETSTNIDLILMDIRRPAQDSYVMLAKIRAVRRLKDAIIVAVTADASEEQVAKARAAGFDAFLAKPLDPDRFPGQIRRVFKGEAVSETY